MKPHSFTRWHERLHLKILHWIIYYCEAPTSHMATAAGSTIDESSQQQLFEQVEQYDWDNDTEFQDGLRAILESSPSSEQAPELTLRARCFFFTRYDCEAVSIIIITHSSTPESSMFRSILMRTDHGARDLGTLEPQVSLPRLRTAPIPINPEERSFKKRVVLLQPRA